MQHFAPEAGVDWNGADVIQDARVVSIPYDLDANLQPFRSYLSTKPPCPSIDPSSLDAFVDNSRRHANMGQCAPSQAPLLASFHGKVYNHKWRGYNELPAHMADMPETYLNPRLALVHAVKGDRDVVVVDVQPGVMTEDRQRFNITRVLAYIFTSHIY